MIGRLNHVAIAVPSLDESVKFYKDVMGAEVSEYVDLPEHGVTVCVVELPNTKIELLQVLGEDSPVKKFIEKRPKGGIHHVCYEVRDIHEAIDTLKKKGVQVLGSGKPRIGMHGNDVVFLDPQDCSGTLIELEEV